MNQYPLEYWENSREEQVIEGAMSPNRCQSIIELAESFDEIDATVRNTRDVDEDFRTSQISWVPWPVNDKRTEWIYDFVQEIIIDINNRCFHFDIRGIGEQLQFTRYNKGGYYNWHMDTGNQKMSIRKFSMTLQLNGPDEYEGGQLQMKYGTKKDKSYKPSAGTAIFFPSYMLHRVAPVTEGQRNSLVCWVSGRPYR